MTYVQTEDARHEGTNGSDVPVFPQVQPDPHWQELPHL